MLSKRKKSKQLINKSFDDKANIFCNIIYVDILSLSKECIIENI